jgi:CDP-glucose 4,6-dehydratase
VTAGDWAGRRVLVTGHTGFKGAWLRAWLEARGAEVAGLALAPPTRPSLHALLGFDTTVDEHVDVRDVDAVRSRVIDTAPDVVFHLAAQSLVRRSYADPVLTFATNALGTAHTLEAVRACPAVRAVVVVTSDKVYAPHPDGEPHDEDSPLGGVDPYSSSKAAAELVAGSYRRTLLADHAVAVATARAGNVIGGGDWGDDRLVPDVVRALDAGQPVQLRYPNAVRPWQHVLDPLLGYILLAERLLDDTACAPAALNFGPLDTAGCTAAEVADALSTRFGGKPGWEPDTGDAPPETPLLRLSARRAAETLGWQPRLDLARALDWTAEWYLEYMRGGDMRAVTMDQIAAYESLA